MVISASVVNTAVLSAATSSFGDGNTRELATAVSTIMGINAPVDTVSQAIRSLQPQPQQAALAVTDVQQSLVQNTPGGKGPSNGQEIG